MNGYLKMYLDDGFERRFKNIALRDHFISNKDLYLDLMHIDGFESDASFFEGFDLNLGDFVLKIENESLDHQMSIVSGLQTYLFELSPATIVFNKKGYLEILDHNGCELEEGWGSSFGYFQCKNYVIFHPRKLSRIEQWQDSIGFNRCYNFLTKIYELDVPAYHETLSHLMYNRLRKMLRLCVYEGLQESINFLNGSYLLRPDIEMMKNAHGQAYDDIISLGTEFIHEASRLKALQEKG